jgi:hypothetical protein
MSIDNWMDMEVELVGGPKDGEFVPRSSANIVCKNILGFYSTREKYESKRIYSHIYCQFEDKRYEYLGLYPDDGFDNDDGDSPESSPSPQLMGAS